MAASSSSRSQSKRHLFRGGFSDAGSTALAAPHAFTINQYLFHLLHLNRYYLIDDLSDLIFVPVYYLTTPLHNPLKGRNYLDHHGIPTPRTGPN